MTGPELSEFLAILVIKRRISLLFHGSTYIVAIRPFFKRVIDLDLSVSDSPT